MVTPLWSLVGRAAIAPSLARAGERLQKRFSAAGNRLLADAVPCADGPSDDDRQARPPDRRGPRRGRLRDDGVPRAQRQGADPRGDPPAGARARRGDALSPEPGGAAAGRPAARSCWPSPSRCPASCRYRSPRSTTSTRRIQAATARALERNYALVVCPPTPRAEIWARIPLDGLIVLDPVAGDPMLLELRARAVPLVLIGRDPTDGHDDYCVDNDHVAGTRVALDHLAERERAGWRCWPATWATPSPTTASRAHRAVVRGARHRAGRGARAVRAAGRPRARRAAARPAPSRRTASTRTRRRSASASAPAASGLGLRIPEDLMVVVAADGQPAGRHGAADRPRAEPGANGRPRRSTC